MYKKVSYPREHNATCKYCGITFFAEPYRLKKATNVFCCSRHSALYRYREKGAIQQIDPEIVAKIRADYESGGKPDELGSKYGVSRGTIFDYKRKEKWIAPSKIIKRKPWHYRSVIENSIGRELLSTETVHHIDGDHLNNEISNLHLFSGRDTHNIAHRSLERAAFELFKLGFFLFDKSKGRYFVNWEKIE